VGDRFGWHLSRDSGGPSATSDEPESPFIRGVFDRTRMGDLERDPHGPTSFLRTRAIRLGGNVGGHDESAFRRGLQLDGRLSRGIRSSMRLRTGHFRPRLPPMVRLGRELPIQA